MSALVYPRRRAGAKVDGAGSRRHAEGERYERAREAMVARGKRNSELELES